MESQKITMRRGFVAFRESGEWGPNCDNQGARSRMQKIPGSRDMREQKKEI